MDGSLGWFTIKPDQMQVINPFLILAFIPLFDSVLYPGLAKCHLLTRPLQRLSTGGLLAALAFVVSAIVETKLEVPNAKECLMVNFCYKGLIYENYYNLSLKITFTKQQESGGSISRICPLESRI